MGYMDKWPSFLGKDKTNPEEHVSGNLARAAWTVMQKNSEGRGCGGAHEHLPRQTELVGGLFGVCPRTGGGGGCLKMMCYYA